MIHVELSRVDTIRAQYPSTATTAAGVGVGSTAAAFSAAYPNAKCRINWLARVRYCVLTPVVHTHGTTLSTVFTLGLGSRGRVAEVTL